MVGVDHICDGRQKTAICQGDVQFFFQICRGHQFAFAQICQCFVDTGIRDTKCHAVTPRPLGIIQCQHQSGVGQRPPVVNGPHTERAMIIRQMRQLRFDIFKAGVPQQRPIAKNPHCSFFLGCFPACLTPICTKGKEARPMQRIILFTVGLAILWSINWGWGYSRNMDDTRAWFDAPAAQVGDVSQRGFPSRYDVTLDDVAIPAIGFTAEFVQILRVVYNADHRIIVLPDEFTLMGQPVSGTGFRASVVRDGDFARITIEGRDITLPQSLRAAHGQISMIPDVGLGQYKLYVALDAATLNGTTLATPIQITADVTLPETIDPSSLTSVLPGLSGWGKTDVTVVTPDETLSNLSLDAMTRTLSGPVPQSADMDALLAWVATLMGSAAYQSGQGS